jgi:hypothetical protein
MLMTKNPYWCVAGALLAVAAAPTPADVIIDDFRSGPLRRAAVQCATFDELQSIATAAFVRRTRLIAGDIATPCGQPAGYAGVAAVAIAPSGPLTVSTDYRVGHRLELLYGQDLARNNLPLNLDFTEGGRPGPVIRVKFRAMDLIENFSLVLYMKDGASRAGCSENLSPATAGFTMEFPLASFVTQLGVPDYRDVDYLMLIAQGGSAMGANDFSLDSIVVASGHQAGASVADCR